MTGRRLAGAAALAASLAGVGLAARPFIGAPPRPPTLRDDVDAERPPAAVTPVALHAASRALACPTARSPRPAAGPLRWCGRFTPGREQTYCPDAGDCRIELIGQLAAAGGPVSVALTVQMHRVAGAWRVQAVRS